MKIAFINSFYYPDEVGGAERSVRFLAENLVKHGHEVLVICTGRSEISETIKGVDVTRLGVANLYYPLDAHSKHKLLKLTWHVLDSYNPFSSRKLHSLLSDFKADVLHTNTVGGLSVSVWNVAKRLKIPVIHTLRDYYLLCPNTAMFKDNKQCVRRCGECMLLGSVRKLASENVTSVVGNSRFILDKHLKSGYFKNASKSVIYNAYAPVDAQQDLRESGVVTLGFIGRLTQTKGIDFLLSAFRLLPKLHVRVRLLIAGSGDSDYLEVLKNNANDLPVEFLGNVLPQNFYSRLNWCVVPSLWDEPLARVLFESFAHGVPVIASRTGGTPELIREGKNGFSYVADDINGLVELLDKAISVNNSEWLDMRNNCFIDGENFRPDRVIANYMDEYLKIASPCA